MENKKENYKNKKYENSLSLGSGIGLAVIIAVATAGAYFSGRDDSRLDATPVRAEVRNIDIDSHKDLILRNKYGDIIKILYGTEDENFEDRTPVYDEEEIKLNQQYREERNNCYSKYKEKMATLREKKNKIKDIRKNLEKIVK